MNGYQNKKTTFVDLGLKEYKEAWTYQTNLFEKLIAIKTANRDLAQDAQSPTANYIIFCEHPHVYTLGKSGKQDNLLVNTESLSALNASYYHINRGGDITYHGPGQLVCYPILDLENFFTDIHVYMRSLEEAVIQTLKTFDIHAGRVPGLTGVWVNPEDEKNTRKICAMGVKTSRWVTMHGLALNVNTNLKYFENIVACGIRDKAVTSMHSELGTVQDLGAVSAVLKEKLSEQFGIEWL